ncbi:hypothetical protein Hypma_006603 [Hypsizygus marmoreus]|uniref:Uncharacterized protein n=1 Tax=Hypsizygus marmoreus TaxID=39966 RepID=A0A369JZ45_HYPMA|nr:hypothetical protein Hypma_006603 [Hypsizygus marmoreus]
MAKSSKAKTPFQRLINASCKKSTHKLRSPWRTRTKRQIIKLTPAEKAAKKIRRREQKASYQVALQEAREAVDNIADDLYKQFHKHSKQYYKEEVMQISRLQKTQKNAGPWNAFVSKEVKRINDERPAGEPKKKVHELIGQISEKWRTLSNDEQKNTTEDVLTSLHDTREMRELASHNVPIASFHDVRVTLETLDEEIQRLHARTRIEVALIAVRSSSEHYNRPHVLTTSDRVSDFFQLTIKENILDVAVRMEAYMLSGIHGVVGNYVQEMILLRKQISSLIMLKLNETAKTTISRMYYHNFDSKITEKHGVIVKNWPLQMFCSPSAVATRVELNLLLNSWKSDTTHFYKMTADEYDAWMDERSNPPVIQMDVDLHVVTPNDVTSNIPSPSGNITTSAVAASRPLTTNFANWAVSGENNAAVPVTKKPRKTRKDKGVPRKKRNAENAGQMQVTV